MSRILSADDLNDFITPVSTHSVEPSNLVESGMYQTRGYPKNRSQWRGIPYS